MIQLGDWEICDDRLYLYARMASAHDIEVRIPGNKDFLHARSETHKEILRLQAILEVLDTIETVEDIDVS